jgi:serine/threonine-protein kinase SRPK3
MRLKKKNKLKQQ